MSMAKFYAEVEKRDARLDAAREKKADDPAAWEKESREYAEWRRALRLLGGRPIGSYPWPADVVAFMRANPDDPRVQAAIAERQAELAAELADLTGGAK